MIDHDILKGLDEAQVSDSRAKYGTNILTPPERKSVWRQFLDKFRDPLIVILLVAGVLSVAISIYEYYGIGATATVFFEPIGIFVAILLATGLSFYFEHSAQKEFEILNRVNDEEPVKVYRSGSITTVPRRDIVVGDVVSLSTGDEVPADGNLLDAMSLTIDESTLTGEPLCHKSTDELAFDPDATYPTNRLLRGTKVIEGHAIYRVDAVGDATEMGKVFIDATTDSSVVTPLGEQMERLGKQISYMSYTVAAAIIAGRLVHHFDWNPLAWSMLIPIAIFFWCIVKKFADWSKRQCGLSIVLFCVVFLGWIVGLHFIVSPGDDIGVLLTYSMQTLMIAVTLIVVSVPEGLPMAVTLSLAFSMRSMLKTNNLVRKLHACETMGAATVICTDKTGTLTQNRMQLSETLFSPAADMRLIEEGMAVNSTAALDTANMRGNMPEVIGNPTEGALMLWLAANGVDWEGLRSSAPHVAELPFSTERKYMATIVRSGVTGQLMLYVKGAPEIVLRLCSSIPGGLTREEIERALADYQARAMRTLGFAMMPLESAEGVIENGAINADGLEFLGVVAISDPVREDVPASVAECFNAGIKVKIVTGDTPGTAREIGRRIGLITDADGDDCVITGPEFAALTDEQVASAVNTIKIISRARPGDKKRLVETLQKNGEVVAVTGDGTNDAPALKAAHVGLSMGDGTSVAKEASDITIIDNSFASIGRAVMWGRSLYRNIQRFLLFQLTVNVTACLLVLTGAFLGTESPLTVTQMLWVNLIMDTFGAMALASLPPIQSVMNDKPRDRRASILGGSLLWDVIIVGLLFFVITAGFLYIFQHADITCMADLLHFNYIPLHELTPYEMTLLFSIFVWLHFWYLFNARAFRSGGSAFNLKGCRGFGVIICIIIVGQILIVEVMYPFFNVVPMRFDDWVIIGVGTSLVLWVREGFALLKRLF